MQAFPDIPIETGPARSGNLKPVLHEIAHALEQLASGREPSVIDLNAMPMTPAERGELETMLGLGEVSARIDAIGRSEILETAVSGVWLIRHFNQADEIVARFIEITSVPLLLISPAEDLADGLALLRQRMDEM